MGRICPDYFALADAAVGEANLDDIDSGHDMGRGEHVSLLVDKARAETSLVIDLHH
jgi:hypothetical protein